MKGITIFDLPIPIIIIEDGKEIDGLAIYVESGGTHNNDIWTVAHLDTGIIRHYQTDQIKYPKNRTFNFYEKENSKSTKKGSGDTDSGKAIKNKRNVQKTKRNS